MLDRRLFIASSLGALATPGVARSASAAAAAPPPAPLPPIDDRTVWLMYDDIYRPAAKTAARLAELTSSPDESRTMRDAYLEGGAVTKLEQAFAEMLGKEACAFFPTGTLANHVAVRVHCGENHRALCLADSHLFGDEGDSAARLAGVQLIPLAAGRGTPTLDEIHGAFDVATEGHYPLKVGAISLESPIRALNGEMIPASRVAEIAAFAKSRGTPMHLDGARLLLAHPSVDVKAYVAPFDTVYVSLYKYLGAPFGAVLMGSKATIAKAVEYRHAYGGLIYQGWIPALLALDELHDFRSNIAKAHGVADELIASLERSGKVRLRRGGNPSNIHFLEMPRSLADAAYERARVAGIRMNRWENGAVAFYVNRTIVKRPVDEYVATFLG